MDLEKKEIKAFITDYVDKLRQGNATILIGAGLSKAAGFVDWKGLLKDLATELGLRIEDENDLISIAQFHKNAKQNRNKIDEKIVNEFTDKDIETENHHIIARLPFNTIWTTNYDDLIEDAHYKYDKKVDVKSEVNSLFINRDNRACILYKMHGDKDHPNKAVLLKEDYEKYYYTHEPFIALLNSELITKSFLFIGFSFTDPNINYVFGRLTHRYSDQSKDHYSIMKRCSINDYKEDHNKFQYETIKQQLFIEELKRYRVNTILIENYPDLTQILNEIERKYNSHSVFISGSAVEYGNFTVSEAQQFLHLLSKRIVERKLNVVNGFGLGVGSSIINGALDAVYANPIKYSEEQLIIKPFPQFETGNKKLEVLWEEYRQKMISRAGIILFVFGNNDEGNGIEDAVGLKREFTIAMEKGLIPIPIHYTGYMTKNIFDDLQKNFIELGLSEDLMKDIANLELNKNNFSESIDQIIEIINKILL
ncbi:SIR2 family protein [Flavobacterium lipolyticum]|uniref:NAD(+) hydrolase ThsA n=1 Tax=Flavobacterium lipolyticum TaxID=2893754 RepID=A0ABS8M234_9FLAO|nr:SIR2 family protein [Flavobacterium sp. F-126]MCC9018899.1 SIR2 family protein [Flavobacterium sp. F-126]